jgi:hypothetical protein
MSTASVEPMSTVAVILSCKIYTYQPFPNRKSNWMVQLSITENVVNNAGAGHGRTNLSFNKAAAENKESLCLSYASSGKGLLLPMETLIMGAPFPELYAPFMTGKMTPAELVKVTDRCNDIIWKVRRVFWIVLMVGLLSAVLLRLVDNRARDEGILFAIILVAEAVVVYSVLKFGTKKGLQSIEKYFRSEVNPQFRELKWGVEKIDGLPCLLCKFLDPETGRTGTVDPFTPSKIKHNYETGEVSVSASQLDTVELALGPTLAVAEAKEDREPLLNSPDIDSKEDSRPLVMDDVFVEEKQAGLVGVELVTMANCEICGATAGTCDCSSDEETI